MKRYKEKKAMKMSGTDESGYGSSAYKEPAYDSSSYDSSPQEQGGTISTGLRHISQTDSTLDENVFKQTAGDMFFKIQGAWTKRDLSGFRNLLNPEILNTFQTGKQLHGQQTV